MEILMILFITFGLIILYMYMGANTYIKYLDINQDEEYDADTAGEFIIFWPYRIMEVYIQQRLLIRDCEYYYTEDDDYDEDDDDG